MATQRQGGAEKTKKSMLKFTLDCQQPADDNIIETKETETDGAVAVNGWVNGWFCMLVKCYDMPQYVIICCNLGS